MSTSAKRSESTLVDVTKIASSEFKLTAEYALRAAIDTQIFSALRELERLDGGRAVQAVYVALLRRLPNVTPDRRRISIDCGFSESSVKRAIKLLEKIGLIGVERVKGQSSLYKIADIRTLSISSECLSLIRKLARLRTCKSRRVTSEPTGKESRVTSEPGSRVTSEPGVGSLLTHKETKKNQYKQQGGVAHDGSRELELTLKKWGLLSASYLAEPGHEKALAVLVGNRKKAAAIVEQTMQSGCWSKETGVGAKVEYLRTNADSVARNQQKFSKARVELREQERLRASQIAESLPTIAVDWQEVLTPPFDVLLKKGFGRLNETEGVFEGLLSNKNACQKIVAGELLRLRLEREVRLMPDSEFEKLCEEVFAKSPGIRSLYPKADKASSGLRLTVLEFMQERYVRNACQSSVGLPVKSEVSPSPNGQHREALGERDACRGLPRLNSQSVQATS